MKDDFKDHEVNLLHMQTPMRARLRNGFPVDASVMLNSMIMSIGETWWTEIGNSNIRALPRDECTVDFVSGSRLHAILSQLLRLCSTD